MITENIHAKLRQNWDNSPVKQVKLTAPSDVASSFKRACTESNVSMAAELTQFIAVYSKTAFTRRKLPPDYSTKRQRRTAIRKFARHLEQIRDCEEQYRDRIPENLQSSAAFDSAEEFISCLNAAIDALDSIDSI